MRAPGRDGGAGDVRRRPGHRYWYAAFLQPSGTTVVVIGDVVGHDHEAAAAMDQVRTGVRALGALDAQSPAGILRDTDRVMANLEIPVTATMLAARLEQTPEEVRLGRTRLRWSSAGHPPPVVVGPRGEARLLTVENDLLLGVAPESDRSDHEVLLARGEIVVLHTDGLVERRDQPLSEGSHRLQLGLSELVRENPDLDGLVDRLLAGMLPAEPEDDVAVLAVRLHPQQGPRPGRGRVDPVTRSGRERPRQGHDPRAGHW